MHSQSRSPYVSPTRPTPEDAGWAEVIARGPLFQEETPGDQCAVFVGVGQGEKDPDDVHLSDDRREEDPREKPDDDELGGRIQTFRRVRTSYARAGSLCDRAGSPSWRHFAACGEQTQTSRLSQGLM